MTKKSSLFHAFATETFDKNGKIFLEILQDEKNIIGEIWLPENAVSHVKRLDQRGGTCGFYALEIALSAANPNRYIPPARKDKNEEEARNKGRDFLPTISLRSFAKRENLTQFGELHGIHEIADIKKITQEFGFPPPRAIWPGNELSILNEVKKPIDGDFKIFEKSIITAFREGNVLMLSYISDEKGFPAIEEKSIAEGHTVLAFGYVYINNACHIFVSNYGKYQLLSLNDLLYSLTLKPPAMTAFYYKNPETRNYEPGNDQVKEADRIYVRKRVPSDEKTPHIAVAFQADFMQKTINIEQQRKIILWERQEKIEQIKITTEKILSLQERLISTNFKESLDDEEVIANSTKKEVANFLQTIYSAVNPYNYLDAWKAIQKLNKIIPKFNIKTKFLENNSPENYAKKYIKSNDLDRLQSLTILFPDIFKSYDSDDEEDDSEDDLILALSKGSLSVFHWLSTENSDCKKSVETNSRKYLTKYIDYLSNFFKKENFREINASIKKQDELKLFSDASILDELSSKERSLRQCIIQYLKPIIIQDDIKSLKNFCFSFPLFDLKSEKNHKLIDIAISNSAFAICRFFIKNEILSPNYFIRKIISTQNVEGFYDILKGKHSELFSDEIKKAIQRKTFKYLLEEIEKDITYDNTKFLQPVAQFFPELMLADQKNGDLLLRAAMEGSTYVINFLFTQKFINIRVLNEDGNDFSALFCQWMLNKGETALHKSPKHFRKKINDFSSKIKALPEHLQEMFFNFTTVLRPLILLQKKLCLSFDQQLKNKESIENLVKILTIYQQSDEAGQAEVEKNLTSIDARVESGLLSRCALFGLPPKQESDQAQSPKPLN